MIALLLLAACAPESIVLEDAMNYSFTTSLTAECQAVPAREDSLVDWSGLTSDLQGHTMDPTTDVTEVRLVKFLGLTREEVLEAISTNGIDQSALEAYASYYPESGETSAPMTSFTFFGTPVPPEEYILADGAAYLVAALTGLYEYRMLTFFCPEKGAPPATVYLTYDSATLTFEADINAGDPIPSEGTEVDWKGLTRDGQDHTFSPSNIDGLMLARYDVSIANLEAAFFDLPDLAVPAWEADVEGVGTWDLTTLETADGTAWESFDEEGIWLLALRCSTCTNPAPLFLGVVD